MNTTTTAPTRSISQIREGYTVFEGEMGTPTQRRLGLFHFAEDAKQFAGLPALIEALKLIHDEADHIIGTESISVASRLIVARRNAKTIKHLVKAAFDVVGVE
jgi:hypothetical protein